MQSVEQKLILILHKRLICVKLIASIKFILNRPTYVPSIEKALYKEMINLANNFSIDPSCIKDLIKTFCKISRGIQFKLRARWSLSKENIFEVLDNFIQPFIEIIPLLDLKKLLKIWKSNTEYTVKFLEQLISIARNCIRFLDRTIIQELCQLEKKLSIDFFQEKSGLISQLSNQLLLYKLFLTMNNFVRERDYSHVNN